MHCLPCVPALSCPFSSVLRTLYRTVFIRRYSTDDDRVFRQQHHHDEYDYYRDYWQRPTFGTGVMAGRSRTPLTIHAARAEGLPFQSAGTIVADVHNDDVQYWRLRDAHHTAPSIWTSGQSSDERPVPPPRRRAMKNIQFSLDAGLTHPFGAKFGLDKRNDTGLPVHNYDLTPSNQASARGSFRSDGSGQSQVRRPYSQMSYADSTIRAPVGKMEVQLQPQSFTRLSNLNSSLPLRPQTLLLYQRQLPSGQQIKPEPQRDLPAGDHRRFPSFGGLSSEFRPEPSTSQRAHQSAHLRELPALCPIHDAVAFARATADNSSSLRATVPIGRSISTFANRVFPKRAPFLEPVPEAIYDSQQNSKCLVQANVWHNIDDLE